MSMKAIVHAVTVRNFGNHNKSERQGDFLKNVPSTWNFAHIHCAKTCSESYLRHAPVFLSL